ncbi:CPBP family glutamic-type intramembrane protease [Occallatibacter riparius]|uniref:CPBP family intramembrane metalloprotease n=1 Tax=Occallatibacter riparius TaxID=1002689 RepID=A0A9J7BN78_9BACT|nr:CPBP family glutamic-type intramembrane protease [Occallatibacter riparius]UWZ84340.1 CPBP family intramembrane metalloprotease [Occallatibacter riparius]
MDDAVEFGTDAGRRGRWLALVELCVGYGLIVATVWTPRPAQAWLWWASALWIAASTCWSFPGWQAMGFRRGGFVASLWVVALAAVVSAAALAIAIQLHTLRIPHTVKGWVLAWGGYTVWSFVQQFLLQGYFLFRLLRLLPRREAAAVTAAAIFAAAHLPNPLLTVVTLIWGTTACFVFLRCRNVYTLMLTHAILGVSLAITVPGPVIHNMRVGIGYLRYRQPAKGKPMLIDPQTGRVL